MTTKTATRRTTKGNGARDFEGWEEAGTGTAYAKVGAFGQAGSGKTTTATLIAIGLAREIGVKQVFMNDTETGSDFVAPIFRRFGIKLRVRKSRAFSDLANTIRQLHNSGEILIVDSISHYWQELIKSYLTRKNKDRLTMPDWGILKPTWNQQWSEPFVCSSLHIITLGRLQFEYEFMETEPGKYELYKSGTKMRAESEFGYEPSLVFEMERLKKDAAEKEITKIVHGNPSTQKSLRQAYAARLLKSTEFVHRATILKDRSQTIMGKEFLFAPQVDEPLECEDVWKAFNPFFQTLNIGGEHAPLDTSKSSEEMFRTGSGEPDWKADQRHRQVVLEEIEGVLVTYLAGHTAELKAAKMAIFQQMFKTRSWTCISNDVPIDLLEAAIKPSGEGGRSVLELACMSKRDELRAEK